MHPDLAFPHNRVSRPAPPPATARRLLATALAVLVVVVLAPAAAAQNRLFEESTVLAVELPVQVTLGGKPVRGLTADNFEVLEGRDKQQIVDFEVIDLADFQGAAWDPAVLGVPSQARRRFLLLFDLSFSDVTAVAKSRQAARDLVLEGLHPFDSVAVATYSASRGAEVLLNFTSDRRQIEHAVESLGVLQPVGRVSDPLRLMLTQLTDQGFGGADGAYTQQDAAEQARNFDAIFMANLRDLAPMAARVNRDQVKNQILAMSSSLAELADSLNSVPGRKQVVLFSEGFDSSLLLGTEDRDRIDDLMLASNRAEVWKIDSDERFGSSATQSGLFGMLQSFRRCDCAIQAVDIGGLRGGADVEQTRRQNVVSARPQGEEGLFIMAEQTGGALYRNYNDLSEAMAGLLDKTSVTYLLVLQPKNVVLDDTYHPLKVRLKKGPKGARVEHRPGYYARPPAANRGEVRRLTTADLITGGDEGGDIATSVLAAPFKSSQGDPYVLTAIEMYGHTLLNPPPGERLPVEVFVYAFDEQGRVSDFLSQAIVVDVARHGDALRNSGFKFVGHLDLPPGDYTLRTLVRSAHSGATGLKTAKVHVPAFADGPTLLPPLFIEPDGAWVLGWGEREQSAERPYPLVVQDKKLVPAAEPMLPAGAEIPLLLVAHNLEASRIAASAELRDRDGSPAGRAQVAIRDKYPTAVPGVDRYWASVRAAAAVAGRYDLVVKFTDAASGEAVESSIPVFLQ